jgi:hypothetical protein
MGIGQDHLFRRLLDCRVRLAREENWNNLPRVVSRISDAISLAKRIYDRMKVDYPALRRNAGMSIVVLTFLT